ncbi:alpha/beta fold hydrolase [Hymenobacter wooponensis]|uniref:alpha/beta fold hydrolase n=1 Tax=Hymenobacter wooponensis TaxID=1525360 RepID=UPI001436B2F4|nr:alpha/beta hydrolase [Hymenobacter wooponensis]
MKTHLNYRKYGTGPKVVLAFHGYGQSEGHWRGLIQLLGPEVTVYAFDLFYHGGSRLAKQDSPLTKQRLAELLQTFLAEQGIESFSLLAFSMGAKFALTAAEYFPERVKGVWLIAPDGIGSQLWYTLAMRPPWMRGLLGRAVLRPQRLLRFLNTLRQRRLLDPNLVHFAQWQLDSREKRLRIYRSWTAFRGLTFDLKRLARVLNQHAIPVTFFLGRHDRVIPPAGIQQFAATLSKADTILLNTGHAGLIYDVTAYLRQHPQLMPRVAVA